MFREVPPKELVEEFLRALGFTSLTDRRTFTKESLSLDVAEEYLLLFLPYYYPCKAPSSAESVVTILRQILRPHGVNVMSFERTKDRKKLVEYQLMPSFKEQLSTMLHVDFL